MEDFSDEQKQEAESILKFYTDLIETKPDMAKYYMTDDIVLDWFGKTVKGEKNVDLFLKSDVSKVRHYFSEPVPAEQIGFRDTHVIKSLKPPKKLPTCLLSPPRISHPKTPRKHAHLAPSTSSLATERGQGDGFHNNNENDDDNLDVAVSPLKKFKTSTATATSDFASDQETVEGESTFCDSPIRLKYVTATGSVEFHRPSIKKLQTETKWKRPCKLNIGYTCPNKNVSEECTIYLVIYESNVKCRRNLLKDFELGEPEN